jgi:lipoprotein LprG
MISVESASFTIDQTGGTVFIDDGEELAFQSAEGRFASPSSSQALLTVEAFGFSTEVGAIAIDGELWFTNPLSGEWTVAPESFTFDPATLFDADVGFPALLTEATATAEFIEDAPDSESPDQENRHHVRATVDAERVAVLTGGLVTQASEVDLWIDADTDRIIEARFDLTVADVISEWRMTIGDYDADITIAPPEMSAEG